MHSILTAILVALANNVDNISARIALSIKGIRLSTPMNLWISAITFVFSLTAAALGGTLGSLINPRLSALIGMAVFTALGLWLIIDALRTRSREKHNKNKLIDILEHPEEADQNHSSDIDFKEATLLGVALSLDSIGGALSAGMIGVNCVVMALFSSAVSFLALWSGNYLAKLFQKLRLGIAGSIIAGALLIAIGVKQLF